VKDEVLDTAKEERNILHTMKGIEANWVCHFVRSNCLLKHVIELNVERKIERAGGRGRRIKQLLDDPEEKRR
jgi:hypothetical protein